MALVFGVDTGDYISAFKKQCRTPVAAQQWPVVRVPFKVKELTVDLTAPDTADENPKDVLNECLELRGCVPVPVNTEDDDAHTILAPVAHIAVKGGWVSAEVVDSGPEWLCLCECPIGADAAAWGGVRSRWKRWTFRGPDGKMHVDWSRETAAGARGKRLWLDSSIPHAVEIVAPCTVLARRRDTRDTAPSSPPSSPLSPSSGPSPVPSVVTHGLPHTGRAPTHGAGTQNTCARAAQCIAEFNAKCRKAGATTGPRRLKYRENYSFWAPTDVAATLTRLQPPAAGLLEVVFTGRGDSVAVELAEWADANPEQDLGRSLVHAVVVPAARVKLCPSLGLRERLRALKVEWEAQPVRPGGGAPPPPGKRTPFKVFIEDRLLEEARGNGSLVHCCGKVGDDEEVVLVRCSDADVPAAAAQAARAAAITRFRRPDGQDPLAWAATAWGVDHVSMGLSVLLFVQSGRFPLRYKDLHTRVADLIDNTFAPSQKRAREDS
jgi:hypothetical protein